MLIDILLVIILVICLITDLKERKIYNKIIFPSLIIAFILNLLLSSWSGLLSSITGFFVGLGILLIPYLMGGMGAGDVKLLALIGAIKGTSFVLYTSVYMALLGGIIAIGILLYRKEFFKKIQSVLFFLIGRRYGMKIHLDLEKDPMKAMYPYGVAITGGAFVSMFFRGWGLL